MKTTKFISLLTLALCFQLTAADAVTDKPAKNVKKQVAVENECLEVSGKPVINGASLKNVSVKLYNKDVLVTEIESMEEAKVFFGLKSNTEYTVRFSKEGYADRLIRFDTHLPKEVVIKPIFRFDFDVEMVPLATVVDPYYLDFPAGLVSYDSKVDKFEHSKKYGACINKMKNEENYNRNRNLGK
jgi:hypothetical protein